MNRSNTRRNFIKTATIAGVGIGISRPSLSQIFHSPLQFPGLDKGKVGMIGLDTSHCEAFGKVLNNPSAPPEFAGFPVTVAYPYGSREIESSYKRIPQVTDQMRKLGVRIAGSIDELLSEADVVLLETNDGRLHYEQALQVMKAGKRLFIDKPISASLPDAIAIFEASKKYNVPVFSCSSLRFTPDIQAIAKGNVIGKVTGADVYTPCELEKTHPDLFWYGIHGVETIYTLMGPGCSHVVRAHQDGTDVVIGTWKDGRIATFRGIREGQKDYGATVHGKSGIKQVPAYAGYEPLLKEVVQFFRSGVVPVKAEETIEICAFMEAADESKRKGGVPVSIDDVMKKVKRRKIA